MPSDDPDADRLLNDHADKLRTIVAAQDRAIVPLKSILRILLQQIIVPAGCHCGYEPWPFDVHRFGSRVYGMALPSSDLDLVCMMWPHHSGGLGPAPLSVSQSAILSIKTLLVAMLERLKNRPDCTGINNAIDYKWTISFCFEGRMRVDFTVHLGDANPEHVHQPSAITEATHIALTTLPDHVRILTLLVVVMAKRQGICFDGKGAIGDKLKTIHWTLLVIAFWRATGKNSTMGLAFELRAFCAHIRHMPFERVAVDALRSGSAPFSMRGINELTGPVWIRDPLAPGRNLGIRVTEGSLQAIRLGLHACQRQLQSAPAAFVDWLQQQNGCPLRPLPEDVNQQHWSLGRVREAEPMAKAPPVRSPFCRCSTSNR